MLPCDFPFLSDRKYLITDSDDAVSKKFRRRLLFCLRRRRAPAFARHGFGETLWILYHELAVK